MIYLATLDNNGRSIENYGIPYPGELHILQVSDDMQIVQRWMYTGGKPEQWEIDTYGDISCINFQWNHLMAEVNKDLGYTLELIVDGKEQYNILRRASGICKRKINLKVLLGWEPERADEVKNESPAARLNTLLGYMREKGKSHSYKVDSVFSSYKSGNNTEDSRRWFDRTGKTVSHSCHNFDFIMSIVNTACDKFGFIAENVEDNLKITTLAGEWEMSLSDRPIILKRNLGEMKKIVDTEFYSPVDALVFINSEEVKTYEKFTDRVKERMGHYEHAHVTLV